VENLAPMQLKQTFNVTVTDSTHTYSFDYGVFSYMYGVLNNPESSAELIYLAKATWLFAEQIETSFASLASPAATETVDSSVPEGGETNDENA
jgi:hypothetical protein